jgi:hypothetical protein
MLNPINKPASNFVLETDVSVCFEFQISPIQVRHINKLQAFFDEDDFFKWGAIRIKSSPWNVYAVEYEEGNNWTDLPEHSDEIELRVNDVLERFINTHGGYEAVKASI